MDGPQIIAWAEGARLCLLWTEAGCAELRVLDGGALIHCEPMRPGGGLQQASELRRIYGTAATDEADRSPSEQRAAMVGTKWKEATRFVL